MTKNDTHKKMTINRFAGKKKAGQKITMLTAYDFYMARYLDQSGIDALLVGDTLSMVLYGNKTTHPATMEMMLAHTDAVSRGTEFALVIADMPFMSYQPSAKTAIANAGRFIGEASAEAVKLEGGIEMAPTVKRITECGIPVMGHIGLTPQSIHKFGGARVQGRNEKSRQYLTESAQALEEAGAFSIVLELVKSETAAEVTKLVKIPTIGIGAGRDCDGQVLVINDLLGLYDDFELTFVRKYADLPPIIKKAVGEYIADVKSGQFPSDKESF
jgi:3-methyl-2-oxobutanoate hydroxymethyltransferase